MCRDDAALCEVVGHVIQWNLGKLWKFGAREFRFGRLIPAGNAPGKAQFDFRSAS